MPLEFFRQLQEELHKVDEILLPAVKLKSGSVQAHLEIDFYSWDKQIYPAVLLSVAGMMGVKGKRVYGLAAVVKFIHLASLVHISDEQDSPAFPVLIGDFLYARFFSTLCEYHNLAALKPLSEAICAINEAAIIRRQHEELTGEVLRQVFMLEGSLMAVTCRLGGWLGEKELEVQETLKVFGHNLGILYNINQDHKVSKKQNVDIYLDGARKALHFFPDCFEKKQLLNLIQDLVPQTKHKMAAI